MPNLHGYAWARRDYELWRFEKKTDSKTLQQYICDADLLFLANESLNSQRLAYFFFILHLQGDPA